MSEAVQQEAKVFCTGVTHLVINSMVGYGNALRWVGSVIEGQTTEIEEDRIAAYTDIATELIGYIRIYELTGDHWAEIDPAWHLDPIIPLARLLGETYLVLRLVKDQSTAANIPIVAPEQMAELYTPEAQAWLKQWTDDIPVLAPAQ